MVYFFSFVKQYGCLKLIHFSKKSGSLSSTGSEILDLGSHCSPNFQPILDCFIPKFKLKYDDLENIKTDSVITVVFNLHQIKQSKFFFGTPCSLNICFSCRFLYADGQLFYQWKPLQIVRF